MKILVACEYSGAVRDAFIRSGHDAMSCDLLPTDVPGPHYQGDVRDVLGSGWDIMIAHPPCTYLCSSGLHWNKRRPGRAALTAESLDFVRLLMSAPIPMIAIENPIGCISSQIRKPDQIIQPWQFGHDESKATCLWLNGLPVLRPTESVQRPAWIPCDHRDGHWCNRHGMHASECSCPPIGEWGNDDPYAKRYANQTASGQNKLPPSTDRWKIRSATYPGIAAAMASQWGVITPVAIPRRLI